MLHLRNVLFKAVSFFYPYNIYIRIYLYNIKGLHKYTIFPLFTIKKNGISLQLSAEEETNEENSATYLFKLFDIAGCAADISL